MTALGEFLFPAPARRTTGAIVRWWESRRLAYNLVVGAAGGVSLGLVPLISSLPPNGHGVGFPFIAVVVVGVMANICYLLGPTVEVAVEKLFRGQILPTGPALYRMGLTFSVGLVLLPTLLMIFEWIYRIGSAIF